MGIVFLGAATCWILRSPLAKLTGLPLDDTIIALTAALLLFAVPISRARRVCARLGGGAKRALGRAAAVRRRPGAGQWIPPPALREWIGGAVAGIEISTIVLVLVVTVAIVYLTEITSNTASTATFLPILGRWRWSRLDPRILPCRWRWRLRWPS